MPGGEALAITTRENGSGWIVALTGELDMASAPRLVEMLNTDRPTTVDSGLTFMDSTGLSALIESSQRCEELRLVPGPQNVQRVFEITNTLDRFAWAAP